MPRAIWTGSISFGLVNVPVRMYSAIEEKGLHFNYVHEPDGGRIGYQKFCKEEERLVPDEEIVKAFEIEKGEWVYMTDEDFEAAAPEANHTIDISDFVPYEDIDPIYFERTYFLGPRENGEKNYISSSGRWRTQASRRSQKCVIRDKQRLGCLRVRDGVVTLERCCSPTRSASWRRSSPAASKVDGHQARDRHQADRELLGPVRARGVQQRLPRCSQRGSQRRAEGQEAAEAGPGRGSAHRSMAALRASLEAAAGRRSATNGSCGNGSLAAKSKDELLRARREADVERTSGACRRTSSSAARRSRSADGGARPAAPFSTRASRERSRDAADVLDLRARDRARRPWSRPPCWSEADARRGCGASSTRTRSHSFPRPATP